MYITKKLKSSFLWYTNCCPLGIHDGALIGMGSTLLDNCEVGEGSIVAAGALVLQNTKIPAGEIWGGVPAKYLKPVRPGQTDNAKHYVAYSKFYLEEGE
jgi:carbonic anhydrase/acetyltransferase-like protein (isoleucine patch superfamily)